MIVFLDTNTLNFLCNPNQFAEAVECEKWFYTSYSRGVSFFTSDLCDYEIRRGLIASCIRSNKNSKGLSILNQCRNDGYISFLAVTKEVLDIASELWARSSVNSQSNKDVKNIDVDIIISAHCQLLSDNQPGQRVIVATINIKDLSIYCEAANWQDIKLWFCDHGKTNTRKMQAMCASGSSQSKIEAP